ncbi:hypothetical protein V8B97DRAFT_2025504 [Scleroderma yunnanense]
MAPGRVNKFFSSLHFHRGSAPSAHVSTSTSPQPPPEVDDVGRVHAGSKIPLRLDTKEHFDRIGRFRILVMGRANAGKTTILQRVCNTTDLPEVFDGKGNKIDAKIVEASIGRGHHNIENELVFQGNPGFIFHDSCGFEAGSANEFELMNEFVAHRATTLKLEQRIHAIWFCIPMTDFHRTITAAEARFFNKCDTGSVPVIVLLTKADTLNFAAIEQLLDEGKTIEAAKEQAFGLEKQMLTNIQTKIARELAQCTFPPKGYLPLNNMNGPCADCTLLLRCTADALDQVALLQLLITTQQANLVLNIEYAVIQ